jgi:hypothetical protein
MIARCWLHIGVEKTGTTSIQSFLAANRAVLLGKGRLYPVAPGRVSHLGLVAFALDDDRIEGSRKAFGLTGAAQIANFRDRLVRELEQEIAASGASEIIFSSELLSSRLRSRAELARIKSLCARIAGQTKIILYLRNQADFLVSRYTTVIQHGGRDEFRLGWAAVADYTLLLARWAGAFGHENLIVRRFEPANFVNEDLLADFATTLGLEPGELELVPRYNESLDVESLAFMRAINRRVPRRFADRIMPLRAAAVTVLQRRRGGTRFVIPPALADRIQARFRASNDRVSAEYFGGRFQPLFPPPALVGRPDELPPKSIGFMIAIRITCFLVAGLIGEFFRRKR